MNNAVTFLVMALLGHILSPIVEHTALHYVPENPKYVTLGCWKDDIPRAMNDHDSDLTRYTPKYAHYKSRKNAIQNCFDLALRNAQWFFAIQDGGQCFYGCPNTDELWSKGAGQCTSEWKMYGPSSECLVDGKGGPMANNVYHIKLDACFDKDVRTTYHNLIKVSTTVYSILDCQTLCQSTSSCMIFTFNPIFHDGHGECILFSSENGRQDKPGHIIGPKYCNSTMRSDTYIEDYSAKQCKKKCGKSCEKMPLKIDLSNSSSCHKTWAMRYCKNTCRLRLALHR